MSGDQASVSIPGTSEVARRIGAGRGRGHYIMRRLGCFVVLVLVVGGGVMYKKTHAASPTRYETHTVAPGNLQVTVSATGQLKTLTTVSIGAEISGNVTRVYVETNDRVTSGQVLAEIDPTELLATVEQNRAQVASAKATISQASATLSETKMTYERSLALNKKNLLSQEDLDTAKAAMLRAEASLASAQANLVVSEATLKSAKTRLSKATIYSPVDGLVLSRLVEPGGTVTSGFQTPELFKVAQDLTKMRLLVDVDEADVGAVQPGMDASFTVEAYPGRTFPSKVKTLYYEPTEESNVVTYQCVLNVDNDDMALRPGMTCTATIVSQKRDNVLLVPNAALRFTPPEMRENHDAPGGDPKQAKVVNIPGMAPVWVVDGEGQKPHKVLVKVGASDGSMTIVGEGSELKEGMRVITDVLESQPATKK
ncbi:MAG: efflux RND transporter periplasmic adaptor subunit [Candidatus Sumerlaeales bacterium]|nr:efflux RND transporter periplasmic adaptor subunit [Candidatus Sumerlaeales bacterium]